MLLPDPFRQFQNCRRDKGSTPVVGSSSTRSAGSWMRAQQAELLPHAAREFPGLPVLERRKARALGQFINAALALRFWLAEEAGEKGDILGDAQVRIKVLSEALRHVGDLEQALARWRYLAYRRRDFDSTVWIRRLPAMRPKREDFRRRPGRSGSSFAAEWRVRPIESDLSPIAKANLMHMRDKRIAQSHGLG